MTKKAGRSPKRNLFILASSVTFGIIVIGIVSWLYLSQRNQHHSIGQEEQATVNKIRDQLDTDAFRGDKDIASRYLERIDSKDADGAVKVYTDAAEQLDKAEKAALYHSATSAAARANREDHRLVFLLKLAELHPHYTTYGAIADIYKDQKDVANQTAYLQKALDRVEQLDHSSQEYKELRELYEQQVIEARQ